MAACKSWVYTVNNPDEHEEKILKSLTATRHRCCRETGDSGTPHFQGAITFRRNYRLPQLQKLLPRAHWEVARSCDAENYCVKGDIIIDIIPKPGERTDIAKLIDDIKRGITGRSLAEAHAAAYLRYSRGIERLQALLQTPDTDWFATNVEVFYGPSGSGKSRRARRLDPLLYNVPTPSPGGVLWFDGYIEQRTILFDDYYGHVAYSYLLQLLDGYPMQVPVKGGFAHRRWCQVIFTSNDRPEYWYPGKDLTPLMRRISHITELLCDQGEQ